MAVTYTTAALVQKRIENIDSTLTTANIEEYIYNAEGVIDAHIQKSFKTGFDSTKHGLIRDLATNLAAVYTILFNPAGFSNNSEVSIMLGVLFWRIEHAFELLKDKKLIDYLKSL